MNRVISYFRDLKGSVFKDWTTFQKIWMVVAALTIVATNIVSFDLGWFMAALSWVICIVMCDARRMSNWAFGLINSLLYGAMYARDGIFGQMILNFAFYVPMQFIGFYIWCGRRDHGDIVKISSITKKTILLLAVLAVIVVACIPLLETFDTRYADAMGYHNYPGTGCFDAISTYCGIVGQFFMNAASPLAWIPWLFEDAGKAVIYWNRAFNHQPGAWTSLAVELFGIINAVYGFYAWFSTREKSFAK
jgi:nicotinamide mononucleotide transporter